MLGTTTASDFTFLLSTLLVVLAPLVAASAAIPKGFKSVVFYDDFTSGTLDLGIWNFDKGTSYPGGPDNWRTHEIQTYTDSPSNIFIKDKKLHIVPQNNNGKWTSARIETNADHDFSCPENGKLLIESKIKLGSSPADSQMGIWPAFWLLGSAVRDNPNSWPSIGEIDIMESPNGQAQTWNTVHCGDNWQGGVCNEPTGLGGPAFPMPRGEWNTLALVIDRESSPQNIVWFVNHKRSFTIIADDVGNDKAWKSLVNTPKVLLLNVAVGGSFPNAIAKATTPNDKTKGGNGSEMQVEHVAVYST